MPTRLYIPLFTLVLLFVFGSAIANSSKELRQQQKAAQKERQVEKKERTEKFKASQKEFKAYAKVLKKEYQEQLADFKIDFDLKRADLQAEHEVKVAEASAENEKKTMGLFMNANLKFDQSTLERLQKEAKTYSDELFVLKKQSAEDMHLERVAFEKRNNKLLAEGEQKAQDKASELGMTKDFSPIIASPIGGSLTRSEQRWNEKENKEVIKLKEKNIKIIRKFKNGKKFRNWELQNINDDFKLTWQEKSDLHELDSQYVFFNAMLMQAFQGGQIDQQEFVDEISEINKKKKLINIEYKKIREKNRIIRNKERKEILNG